MNDDHPTTPAAADPTSRRDRLVRVGRSLAACAVRGLATGTGTAAGTWIVWWVIHH